MKKYLLILLLSISSGVYSQGLVNAYNFTTGTGTTLYDRVSTNNGTLGGVSLPVWSTNGYLSFTGGNSTTQGDRCRVDLTRISYAWNQSHSYVVVWRSTKSDAAIHTLYNTIDRDAPTSYETMRIDASEKYLVLTKSGTPNDASTVLVTAQCDGQWHVSILTYSTNNFTFYLDGNLLSNTKTSNYTSGNFYTTNSKSTIGAAWNNTGANYCFDFTGDICLFKNFNSTLSVADQQNEVNEYLQMIY